MGLFFEALSKASLSIPKGNQGLWSPVVFNYYFLKGQIPPFHLYHFLFHLAFFSFYLYFNISLILQNLGFGDDRCKEQHFRVVQPGPPCG